MTELVEYLVKQLVDHPEAVEVAPFEDEYGFIYEVRVDPADMGKVIGRGGRVINAVRTVVRSVAQRQGMNAQVEILEPDEGPADSGSGSSGLNDATEESADSKTTVGGSESA